MSAIDGKILATKCPCYITGEKMTPEGIVLHSTGANNPYLKRYVQPDDGVIGVNVNNNSWNTPQNEVISHAIIGKDKNDKVKTYQVLPFDICCWCVGSGSKGSYNYNPAYLQFEICEDNLSDKSYCLECYNKAVELCVYWCKTYKISPSNIVSHHEAAQRGMGSSHVDPDHWWGKYGLTMTKFRQAVQTKLNGTTSTSTSTSTTSSSTTSSSTSTQTVSLKKGTKCYSAADGKTVSATIKADGVFTITETKTTNGTKYGKLKSGAGWVVLSTFKSYTKTLKAGTKIYTAADGKTVNGQVEKDGTFTIIEEKTTSGVKYGKLKSGAGWVKLSSTSTTTSTTSSSIKKGDKVKVKSGSKDYNGGTLQSWIYNTKMTVLELSGDRAVISSDGKNVTCAINIKNLIKA